MGGLRLSGKHSMCPNLKQISAVLASKSRWLAPARFCPLVTAGDRSGPLVTAGDRSGPFRTAGDRFCPLRSEEHTSELQSLMRISYAVFCLKQKKKTHTLNSNNLLTRNHTTTLHTIIYDILI